MPSVVDERDQPAGIPEIEVWRQLPVSARWTRIATAVQMNRRGVPIEEIAAYFKRTPSTIYRWFEEFEVVARELFAP